MEFGPCFVCSSGVTLILCGFATIASSYHARSMMSDSFNTACAAQSSADGCLSMVVTKECRRKCTGQGLLQWQEDECYYSCVNRQQYQYYEADQCLIDIKREGGCVCRTSEARDCDCSTSMLGRMWDSWTSGCFAMGIVGFIGSVFVTGIPAILASREYGRICNSTCYSFAAGLLSVVFLALGGCFVVVGLLFKTPGPIQDYIRECEEQILIISSGIGLQTLSVDLYSTSIGVGMPFFVAGLVMFCGCFINVKGCCCHRTLPPKDARISEWEYD